MTKLLISFFTFSFKTIFHFQACNCDVEGSVDENCDAVGTCSCRPNVEGDKCTHCQDGYATFPECDECAIYNYGYPYCQRKICYIL